MRRLLSYVIGGAVVLAAGCSEPTGSNRPLSGMVEAFAPPQLTVAGRTVLTSDATIIARGGTRLTLSAVRVGEAVEVHGRMRSDGGVDADEIDVDDDGIELRGTIDAIAAPNLTVAGRTVVTDSATRIGDDEQRLALAALKVGDTVKVEGQLQADSSVLAREIEIRHAEGEDGDEGGNHEAAVRGAIDAISLPNLTVAGKKVVTDSATRIERGDSTITAADLKVGDTVSVEGVFQADSSILARRIEVRGAEMENPEGEVEGAIDTLAPPSLTVAGRHVQTDSATVIRHDGNTLTLADLKVGERVKVGGVLHSDGTILAREIDIEE